MGVNNQSSREALVKVRCWLSHRFPASCYEADNITFVAGSNTSKYISIKAAPVAKWLRPLMLNALNLSSSYGCRFEPGSHVGQAK